MDTSNRTELGVTTGEYLSFGKQKGVELLRYKHQDGSLSGIVFMFEGGLLTARHVVEIHNLEGFYVHKGVHIDIAVKKDSAIKGLKLGYIDDLRVDGAEIITSRIEQPNNIVIIPGYIYPYAEPSPLKAFSLKKGTDSLFVKPGLSGSPIIYRNHIIGIVPFQNISNPYEIPVIAFLGKPMREVVEKDLGLELEEIE